MDLFKTLRISASGLKAEGERMRVVAENIANADTVSDKPGGDPYRRKLVTFKNALDRVLGTNLVKTNGIVTDKTDFQRKYDPGNPAADADGFVLTSNVKPLIEMMDLREAQRSYEANLSVVDASRTMLLRTIDVLRS
ncbi:MAG TPA: flagellar basal body rod protein FlgC [Alphaproteobacteria bacterium]|nr:flagellar basal body rod protein FlgC [Alphaproteobacteria bacterium]